MELRTTVHFDNLAIGASCGEEAPTEVRSTSPMLDTELMSNGVPLWAL